MKGLSEYELHYITFSFFQGVTAYQAEKVVVESELQIGKGLLKLRILLGKMADFGERKENYSFSGLAA